jgi:UDP-N-acetylglucosamine:LPS N-acetylglucosamine transferase
MQLSEARPMRPRRVLAIASGGGHWVELRRIAPAFAGCELHYATVSSAYAEEVPGVPFHTVPDATAWDRVELAKLAWRVLRLIARVRPDVIATTGAAPGLFAVAFGRLFGARTIWLDSLANVEEISRSGRLARRFAHLWLTQWPHLARPEGPQCFGAVL